MVCLFLFQAFVLVFRWLTSFWSFFYTFLRRKFYNTWKNHKNQIIVFNKTTAVRISRISNHTHISTHYEILNEFCIEILLINVSKMFCGIFLILFWLWTEDKILKTWFLRYCTFARSAKFRCVLFDKSSVFTYLSKWKGTTQR